MRKPFVAGNWKMNGLCSSVRGLLQGLKQDAEVLAPMDVAVFPSALHLGLVQEALKDTAIAWGGQNLYLGESGAFTGEISGAMLRDLGCRYVLVGHSERRALFHEDSNEVALKFQAALQARLQPILCVGETLKQRERGETEGVIQEQLGKVLAKAGISAFRQALIAYEPVWAIGTGLTATPEQAQAIHASLRRFLAVEDVEIAQTIRILYGGSLKADNAAQLFAMPDIDGGLVGGASLEAKSFLAICQAAVAVKLGQKA